nr:MBL fold metallo-hydrolase [Angustibacter aerolatus]
MHAGDETEVGGVRLKALGGRHAVIHPDLPRIGNVGLLLGRSRAEGGTGALLHPGDAYDVVPADVDVLALPLWAPWAKSAETVDYLRAVRPAVAVPIHDGPLQPAARGMYVGHARTLGPEGSEVRPLDAGIATDPLG